MRKIVSEIFGLSLLAWSFPSFAQDGSYQIQMDAISSNQLNTNIVHVGGLIREQARAGSVKQMQEVDPNLVFRAKSERRMENFDAMMRQYFGSDASRTDQLARTLGNGRIIVQVGDLIESRGLDRHNVADVYAWWSIEMWNAANRTNADASDATLKAVRDQMSIVMRSSPEIIRLDDTMKQRLTEQMMFQTVVMALYRQQVDANPSFQTEYRNWITQSSKSLGPDLMTVKLTRRGFEPHSSR